jgi:hypothetical protein
MQIRSEAFNCRHSLPLYSPVVLAFGPFSFRFLPVLVLFVDIICVVSRLGDVVVSVLATGSMGRGFKPDRGDGFLRAKKAPSFEREVKPEAPCRKILRHIKNLLTCLRYWYAIFFLLRPFLLLASICLCW